MLVKVKSALDPEEYFFFDITKCFAESEVLFLPENKSLSCYEVKINGNEFYADKDDFDEVYRFYFSMLDFPIHSSKRTN